MREYQSNSRLSKEKAAENAVEKKEIKKVVSGEVKTRSNVKRKFTDIFISEDASNVKSYIFMDVLVPAIKKAISDIVTDGIDMVLYGSTGGRHRDRNSGNNRINYRSYSDNRNDRVPRTQGRFDYDDIIFGSRREAEDVYREMLDLIEEYGLVRVAEMYEMAGLASPYTSNNYGWTNLRTAEVVRIRDGYIIKLPRPLAID